MPAISRVMCSSSTIRIATIGTLDAVYVSAFAAGGRTDLVDKETAEMVVLQAYLPQRLSADEVAAEVARIVKELGAAGPGDMGKVMGAVKSQLAGKADMALVSAAVKGALK